MELRHLHIYRARVPSRDLAKIRDMVGIPSWHIIGMGCACANLLQHQLAFREVSHGLSCGLPPHRHACVCMHVCICMYLFMYL